MKLRQKNGREIAVGPRNKANMINSIFVVLLVQWAVLLKSLHAFHSFQMRVYYIGLQGPSKSVIVTFREKCINLIG